MAEFEAGLRPPTWGEDDLFPLLAELRGAGFAVGVKEYLLALEAAQAAGAAGGGDDPIRLRNYLAPVVCANPDQQADFYRRFNDWWVERCGGRQEEVGMPPPPPLEQREVREVMRKTRPWKWGLAGVTALVAVVASSVLIQHFREQRAENETAGIESGREPIESEPTENGPTENGTTFTNARGDRPGVTVLGRVVDLKGKPIRGAVVRGNSRRFLTDSSGGVIGRFTGRAQSFFIEHADYRPTPVFQVAPDDENVSFLAELSPRRHWLRWLQYGFEIRIGLAVVPLLVTLTWLAWRRTRRRLVLERRSAGKRQALSGVGLPEPRHGLYRGAGFARVRVEARRRYAAGPGELDSGATVEATSEQLGWLTPVYRARLELPVHLALIDSTGFRDQQARRIDEFLDRLHAGGVEIDRYDFHGDPRLCAPRWSGAVHRDLRELAALHPHHRLLIFTDGGGLTHPVTGRFARWTELFSAWQHRALLTPVPVCDRTRQIGKELGFRVLPATPEGLHQFVASLQDPNGAGEPPGGGWRLPLPELLVQRPERWLERTAPAPEEVNALCRALRAYLGADGYRWLNALAVYPELEWHLTLHLGLRLRRADGAPVLDETTLAELTRLPWLRHGTMPDWLRLRLMRELSEDDETTVRDFLRDLLEMRLENPGSRFRLDVAPPPGPKTKSSWKRFFRRRAWKQLLVDLLRTEPEDTCLHDHVFVGFLLGKRPQKLQLLAPGNWRRWVYEHGQPFLGLRAGAPLVVALVLAVAALASGRPLDRLAAVELPPSRISALWMPENDRASVYQSDRRLRAAAFCQDGERLAVRLARGGEEVRRLDENGAWVAAASADCQPRFDSDSLDDIELGRLDPDHPLLRPATMVRLAPDGKRLLTTSGTLAWLWDLDKGRLLATIDHGDDENIVSADFSPDGTKILTANEVAIWTVRETGPPATAKPWRPVTAAQPQSARLSIAVMSFLNQNREPQDDWLRRGLAELVSFAFSQSPEIDVRDAEDSGISHVETLSPEKLRESGIDIVLQGSFNRRGDTYRIHFEVRGSGLELTGEPEGTDPFAIVDEICWSVQRRLDIPQTDSVKNITTSSIEAWRFFLEGRKLYDQSKWEEALSKLEEAIKLDPGFALALADLGNLHTNLNQSGAAQDYYRRAYEKCNRLPPRVCYFVEGEYFSGSWPTYDSAIDAFRRGLTDFPDDSALQGNLAGLYADLERHEEAIREYQAMINRGSRHAGTHYALAMIHGARDDFETGYQILDAFTRDNPDHWMGELALGWHLTQWGKLDEAVEHLRPADTLRPNNDYVREGWWRLRIMQEDWNQAALDARQLVQSIDFYGRWRGSVCTARNHLYAGRSDEALHGFRESAGAYSEPEACTALSHCLAAQLLLQTGQPAQALEEAEKAQQEAPGQWPELRGMFLAALALQELGRSEEADRLAATLRDRTDRDNPRAVEQRLLLHLNGRLALARADAAGAIRDLTAAVELLPPRGGQTNYHLEPDHVPLWYALGEAELAAGNRERAAGWFRKVIESGAEHIEFPVLFVRSHYQLGKIYEALGEPTKAAAAYARFGGYWRNGDLDRDAIRHALSNIP